MRTTSLPPLFTMMLALALGLGGSACASPADEEPSEATSEELSLLRAEGRTSADVAIVPLERSLVEALLPKSLELGEQALTDTAHHPVIFLSAEQKNVHAALGPIDLPGLDVRGMTVIIPATRLRDGKVDCAERRDGPFNYMSADYENHIAAQLTGAIYGDHVTLADILHEGASWRLRTKDGMTRLTVATSNERSFEPNDQTRHEIERMFTSRFVSRRLTRLGTYVLNQWGWELGQAAYRTIDADLDLVAPLDDSIAAPLSLRLRGDAQDGYAFHFEAAWSMGPPRICIFD